MNYLNTNRQILLQTLQRNTNTNYIAFRAISTSKACNGRRNFRKFPIPNKRGIFEHRKLPKELLEDEYSHVTAIDDLKIRYPGVWFQKKFEYVREMEPDLIVPDFEHCSLKPYVSHKAEEIFQSPFTSQYLFNVTYGKDIFDKFQKNEPIPESLLEYDEKAAADAKNNALKTGSDLFDHRSYFGSFE